MDAFTQDQNAELSRDPALGRYASLSTDHVVGLLDACGNYLARRVGVTDDQLPVASWGSDTSLVEAHRAFIESCRSIYEHRGSLPERADTRVFPDRVRAELRLHKYVRGFESITRLQ